MNAFFLQSIVPTKLYRSEFLIVVRITTYQQIYASIGGNPRKTGPNLARITTSFEIYLLDFRLNV